MLHCGNNVRPSKARFSLEIACAQRIAALPLNSYISAVAQSISLFMKHLPDGRAFLKRMINMSTIELNRGVAAHGFGGVVANFFSMLSAWNDARVTRRELNRLSDRELNDIGLCRGDIERIARDL
jgi:uncharacterized protein YjiS (DUF1127 family)